MKLLFVSHEWEKNGATASMVTLIKELKKREDVQVEVLLPRYGKVEAILKAEKILYKVIYSGGSCMKIGLKKKKMWKWLRRECLNVLAVIQLAAYIKKKDFDYIISNSTAIEVGARAAKLTKRQHLFYVREFMEEGLGLEYSNPKRMKKLFEQSEKAIFISEAIERKYLEKYHFKSYKTVYDGVEEQDYYIDNHKILEHKKIGIIQMGRICEEKGSKESVEVINEVKGNLDWHLILLGSGEKSYVENLKKYITENKLEEYISIIPYDSDVKSHLEKADILLMNSRAEGFGRVTVEGMLGGLLVVGRDTAGTHEILNDKSIGCLYRDKEELGIILQDIKRNKEKYKKIASNGQKSARERFAPKRNAECFLSYLMEMEH